MPFIPPSTRLALLLAAVAVGFPAVSHFAVEATPDETLLAALDSTDGTVRREATLALRRDSARSQAAWKALYAAATTLQQKDVIADAIRHRVYSPWATGERPPDKPNTGDEHFDFSKEPNAGVLGVRTLLMRPGDRAGLESPAYQVLGTLSGFPAHELLFPGDLILGIGEVAWTEDTTSKTLSDRLASMASGSRVVLLVERDGKRQQIPMAVGSGLALKWIWRFDRVPATMPAAMAEAWKTWARETGVPE